MFRIVSAKATDSTSAPCSACMTKGISLLVTSDCGTTSHKEIALAAKLGMDVVVTDHHQSDEEMPPAVAVLNPHRADAHLSLSRSLFRGAGLQGGAGLPAALWGRRGAAGVVARSRGVGDGCRCRSFAR